MWWLECQWGARDAKGGTIYFYVFWGQLCFFRWHNCHIWINIAPLCSSFDCFPSGLALPHPSVGCLGCHWDAAQKGVYNYFLHALWPPLLFDMTELSHLLECHGIRIWKSNCQQICFWGTQTLGSRIAGKNKYVGLQKSPICFCQCLGQKKHCTNSCEEVYRNHFVKLVSLMNNICETSLSIDCYNILMGRNLKCNKTFVYV